MNINRLTTFIPIPAEVVAKVLVDGGECASQVYVIAESAQKAPTEEGTVEGVELAVADRLA